MNQARPAPRGAGGLGITDLLRGFFFLLGHPRLWVWLIVPFFTNLAIWIGCYEVLIDRPMVEHIKPWIAENLGDYAVLGWLARSVLTFFFALGSIVAFGFLGALVNAPFYDLLSEATERAATGIKPMGGGVLGFIRALIAAGFASLWIFLWYILWLPLLLIPVAGQILYFLAMARLRTFELLVFTWARKGYRLRDMRAFHKRITWRSFGLGGGLNRVMLLPTLLLPLALWTALPMAALTGLVAWIATPAGVVGATLLFLDVEATRAPAGLAPQAQSRLD